jgi:hypothetical protein
VSPLVLTVLLEGSGSFTPMSITDEAVPGAAD